MSRNSSRDDLEGSNHNGVGQIIRRMSNSAIKSMSRNSSSNSLNNPDDKGGEARKGGGTLNDAYWQYHQSNPGASTRADPEVRSEAKQGA